MMNIIVTQLLYMRRWRGVLFLLFDEFVFLHTCTRVWCIIVFLTATASL